MRIAEATEHLAHLLYDYYDGIHSNDVAIPFLLQVARIRVFREQGNLDVWETAVLNVFSDEEWDEFEQRPDFDILESVWEVGRLNMYGAIDAHETKRFYQEASKAINNLTGQTPLAVSMFDLSEW